MSYTEFHKGKLRILTRSSQETLDYIKKNNLENSFKKYYNEIDWDPIDEKYFILHKDAIYYGEGKDCWLCEFIEHTEQESGGDYLADVKRISKDEYEFTCIFYNGGTWLGEILDEKISEIEKQPFNKEFEMVKISPRESYMILDMASFVLGQLLTKGEDYLYCNYSKQEIAELGQRFGDLNLKNSW